jgi:hypothetical protein
MPTERINKLQSDINAKLEVLKAANEPAKRHELMREIRNLFAELERVEANWE